MNKHAYTIMFVVLVLIAGTNAGNAQDLQLKIGESEITAVRVPGLVSVSGFQSVNPNDAMTAVAGLSDKLTDEEGTSLMRIVSPEHSEIILQQSAVAQSKGIETLQERAKGLAGALDSVQKASVQKGLQTRSFYRFEGGRPFRLQGSYSVLFKEELPEELLSERIDSFFAEYGLIMKTRVGRLFIFGHDDGYMCDKPDTFFEQVRNQLEKDNAAVVESAVHNFAVIFPQEDAATLGTPLVDPSWYRGKNGMGIDQSQEVAKSVVGKRRDVRVAIVDSGLSFRSPLLKAAQTQGRIIAGFDSFQYSIAGKTDWNDRTSFENKDLDIPDSELLSPMGINEDVLHGSKVFAVINSIAPEVSILNVKVFGGARSNSAESLVFEDSVLAGFAWCLDLPEDRRPHIINASLGYGVGGNAATNRQRAVWKEILSECTKKNVLVVVAAGNEGTLAGGQPLDCPAGLRADSGLHESSLRRSVLTVGACGPRHDVMLTGKGLSEAVYGSNGVEIRDYTRGIDSRGGLVDIVAFSSPSLRALETNQPYYSQYRIDVSPVSANGFGKTSAATAIVSGIAALAKAIDQKDTLGKSEEIVCLLQSSAAKPFLINEWSVEKNGLPGRVKAPRDPRFGYGVVNAERAIKEIVKRNNDATSVALNCDGVALVSEVNILSSFQVPSSTLTALVSDETKAQTSTVVPAASTPESEIPAKVLGRKILLPLAKDDRHWVTIRANSDGQDSKGFLTSLGAEKAEIVPERIGKNLFHHFIGENDKMKEISERSDVFVSPVRDLRGLSAENSKPLLFGKIIVQFASTTVDRSRIEQKARDNQFRVEWTELPVGDKKIVEALLVYDGDMYPSESQYCKVFKDLDSPEVIRLHPRLVQSNSNKAD